MVFLFLIDKLVFIGKLRRGINERIHLNHCRDRRPRRSENGRIWFLHECLQSNGICPFCQNKTITIDLKSQFDAYFSGEYERQVVMLESLEKQYSEFISCTSEKFKILISSVKTLPLEIDSSLSHNTLRGAAGGAVLLAELLCAENYITRK